MKINNKNAEIGKQINIENNHAPIHLQGKTSEGEEKETAADTATLKQMMAANQLKEVLAILVATFPNNNAFMLQKSRFSSLEKNHQIGILSGDEYNRERNKIAFAILDMIDEL